MSSSKPSATTNVIVLAGMHAREWISITTAQYLASSLLSGYGTDPRITALMDKTRFTFVPVVNPDGYEYTWTTDRFWRKNRAKVGTKTAGVDLNRNFGFHSGTGGSSANPTDDTYRGPSAFSEPESSAVRDLVEATPNLALFGRPPRLQPAHPVSVGLDADQPAARRPVRKVRRQGEGSDRQAREDEVHPPTDG